jgi:hypothetical protein
MSTPTTARTGAQARKVVVIAREHSAWHAPSGRTENCGAAFEQFVLRILEHDPEIELALACAGVLSEPIRGRAARSGLHLWDGPVDPG